MNTLRIFPSSFLLISLLVITSAPQLWGGHNDFEEEAASVLANASLTIGKKEKEKEKKQRGKRPAENHSGNVQKKTRSNEEGLLKERNRETPSFPLPPTRRKERNNRLMQSSSKIESPPFLLQETPRASWPPLIAQTMHPTSFEGHSRLANNGVHPLSTPSPFKVITAVNDPFLLSSQINFPVAKKTQPTIPPLLSQSWGKIYLARRQEQKNPEAAAKLLQEVIDYQEASPDAHDLAKFQLATIKEKSDPEAAARLFQQMIDEQETTPETRVFSRLHLAGIKVESDPEDEAATKLLQQVIDDQAACGNAHALAKFQLAIIKEKTDPEAAAYLYQELINNEFLSFDNRTKSQAFLGKLIIHKKLPQRQMVEGILLLTNVLNKCYQTSPENDQLKDQIENTLNQLALKDS